MCIFDDCRELLDEEEMLSALEDSKKATERWILDFGIEGMDSAVSYLSRINSIILKAVEDE